MLAFAHPGLTLGAAAALTVALQRRHYSQSGTVPNGAKVSGESWLSALGRRVDIRLLLIGSLLPDIIDKPVGHVFFRETFSDGRIFSHTLVFLIVMSLVGLYLYRRFHRNWLLVLAFGTFSHLVLDEMWLTPQTLLWPVFGFQFPRADLSNWALSLWQALLTEPSVYMTELLGFVILLWFGVMLIRRRRLFAFVWRGRVE